MNEDMYRHPTDEAGNLKQSISAKTSSTALEKHQHDHTVRSDEKIEALVRKNTRLERAVRTLEAEINRMRDRMSRIEEDLEGKIDRRG